jgi:hypothetical protein
MTQACATTLSSARATVVDVNTSQSPGLAVEIPPRSSSLIGTAVERSSQTAFHGHHSLDLDLFESSDEEESNLEPSWALLPPPVRQHHDLAMSRPHQSPSDVGFSFRHSSTDGVLANNLRRKTTIKDYPGFATLSSENHEQSISEVLSALDEFTSNLPPNTLLPDTPCISAIRTYSQASWRDSDIRPRPLLESKSPFSQGVDWRPRRPPPKTDHDRRLLRTSSSRTAKTLPPESDLSYHPGSFKDTVPLKDPNLELFHSIFPTAASQLHSALYSHLVAYNYLASLPPTRLIHSRTDTTSPPLYIPFYSTSSQTMPSKAADRLGIPITVKIPKKVNVGGNAVLLRKKGQEVRIGELVARLKGAIAWLVREMSDSDCAHGEWMDSGIRGRGRRLDEAFLRALTEIVKVCDN